MVDLHNDFLTELEEEKIENYIKDNEKYLQILCCPVWTTQLHDANSFINKKQNMLKNIQTKTKLLLCLEDMDFIDSLSELNLCNIFYCGLCWNNDNKYCGGAYSKGKLTNKGKEIVKCLEKSGVVCDVAHMNKSSFNSFVSLTQNPIFCSHTGFSEIQKDRRNLCKSQLECIVSSGGLCGLYFVGKYLANSSANIYDVVKNIYYFVSNFGCKNLAIGSDFYGTTDLPNGIKDYNDVYKLKKELIKVGLTTLQIEDIFTNNANNFIKKFANKKDYKK